ncbi:unnamed protein product [Rhodiola kirilowii]
MVEEEVLYSTKPSTRLEETASKPSQAAEPSVAVPVSDSEEESMVLRSGELATNPSWFTPKSKIDSSFRTRSLAFVKGLTISHSMLPVYPAGLQCLWNELVLWSSSCAMQRSKLRLWKNKKFMSRNRKM